MRKLPIETQQETLWKSVENQVDLQAAGMVQPLKPLFRSFGFDRAA
jgi:hypothetical protein